MLSSRKNKVKKFTLITKINNFFTVAEELKREHELLIQQLRTIKEKIEIEIQYGEVLKQTKPN